MHDALYCGRRFRTLKVIDEANRECLTIDAGVSISSARLIRVLNRLIDYNEYRPHESLGNVPPAQFMPD